MTKLLWEVRVSGQALLVVLLSMAVVLTVVLSILSSTITDISITSKEEEALRSFSAAEAGIEQALITGSSASGDFEGASFQTAVVNVAQGAKAFVYPLNVASGDNASLWFVGHDDSGILSCAGDCFSGSQMKICWGKSGTPADDSITPAIELTFLYAETPGNYSTVKIAREAVDPNASRRSTNSFSAPDAGGCSVEETSYAFQKTISFADLGIPASSYNFANGLQTAKVKILYADENIPLAFDLDFPGNSLLPSQGGKIESTGQTGESTRKIEVYKLFSVLPTIFDSAVFSSGGLVK